MIDHDKLSPVAASTLCAAVLSTSLVERRTATTIVTNRCVQWDWAKLSLGPTSFAEVFGH
jgi:hypothetical protein